MRFPASERPTRSRHSSTRRKGIPATVAIELQVVPGRPGRVEARRLEDGAHPHGGIGQVPVVVPVDQHGARGRGDEAEEHPQGGRLAGPVRSEEPGDPAGESVEVEVVDGEDVSAEALRQPPSLDGRHIRLDLCSVNGYPHRAAMRVDPTSDSRPRCFTVRVVPSGSSVGHGRSRLGASTALATRGRSDTKAERC